MSDKDFLFFFDNTDHLLPKKVGWSTVLRNKEFIDFCDHLHENCDKGKILMTCREDYKFSQYETTRELHGFQNDKEKAWKLFQKSYVKSISPQ